MSFCLISSISTATYNLHIHTLIHLCEGPYIYPFYISLGILVTIFWFCALWFFYNSGESASNQVRYKNVKHTCKDSFVLFCFLMRKTLYGIIVRTISYQQSAPLK